MFNLNKTLVLLFLFAADNMIHAFQSKSLQSIRFPILYGTKTSECMQSNIIKASKKAIVSTLLTFSLFSGPPAGAIKSPGTSAVLEQSIEKLESSETRADVVQSLADLFEAAGTKTLLARTKYKYVSITTIVIYTSYISIYHAN